MSIGLPLGETVVVPVVPGELIDPRSLNVGVVVKSDVVVEDLGITCILHRADLTIGDAGRGRPIDGVVMHVDVSQPPVLSGRVTIALPTVLLPHGNCTAILRNSDRVVCDLDETRVGA